MHKRKLSPLGRRQRAIKEVVDGVIWILIGFGVFALAANAVELLCRWLEA